MCEEKEWGLFSVRVTTMAVLFFSFWRNAHKNLEADGLHAALAIAGSVGQWASGVMMRRRIVCALSEKGRGRIVTFDGGGSKRLGLGATV